MKTQLQVAPLLNHFSIITDELTLSDGPRSYGHAARVETVVQELHPAGLRIYDMLPRIVQAHTHVGKAKEHGWAAMVQPPHPSQLKCPVSVLGPRESC